MQVIEALLIGAGYKPVLRADVFAHFYLQPELKHIGNRLVQRFFADVAAGGDEPDGIARAQAFGEDAFDAWDGKVGAARKQGKGEGFPGKGSAVHRFGQKDSLIPAKSNRMVSKTTISPA
jgi:hypothetical protein